MTKSFNPFCTDSIMPSFKQYCHVTVEESWLGQAARAEASLLPALPITTCNNTHQIILVRYTNELHTSPFIYENLRSFGAMWTDAVTTHADRTGDITGMNYGGQWKGLQVVRLSLPKFYQVGQLDDLTSVLASSWGPRMGTEFALRLDVPTNNFFNIAFDYDPGNRSFLKPQNYTIPAPSTVGQLPEF